VAEVECPSCGSAELDLVEVLPDERRRIACSVCGHEWLRGEAKRVYRSTTTIDDLRGKFPTPADVLPANLQRAETLKAQRPRWVSFGSRIAERRALAPASSPLRIRSIT
jgi:hypothetical protein